MFEGLPDHPGSTLGFSCRSLCDLHLPWLSVTADGLRRARLGERSTHLHELVWIGDLPLQHSFQLLCGLRMVQEFVRPAVRTAAHPCAAAHHQCAVIDAGLVVRRTMQHPPRSKLHGIGHTCSCQRDRPFWKIKRQQRKRLEGTVSTASKKERKKHTC